MTKSSSFCAAVISFLAFEIRMTGVLRGVHTFRCSFGGYFLFFFGGSVIALAAKNLLFDRRNIQS